MNNKKATNANVRNVGAISKINEFKKANGVKSSVTAKKLHNVKKESSKKDKDALQKVNKNVSQKVGKKKPAIKQDATHFGTTVYNVVTSKPTIPLKGILKNDIKPLVNKNLQITTTFPFKIEADHSLEHRHVESNSFFRSNKEGIMQIRAQDTMNIVQAAMESFAEKGLHDVQSKPQEDIAGLQRSKPSGILPTVRGMNDNPQKSNGEGINISQYVNNLYNIAKNNASSRPHETLNRLESLASGIYSSGGGQNRQEYVIALSNLIDETSESNFMSRKQYIASESDEEQRDVFATPVPVKITINRSK